MTSRGCSVNQLRTGLPLLRHQLGSSKSSGSPLADETSHKYLDAEPCLVLAVTHYVGPLGFIDLGLKNHVRMVHLVTLARMIWACSVATMKLEARPLSCHGLPPSINRQSQFFDLA